MDKVAVLEVKNNKLYFHFRLCHYGLYKNDFTFTFTSTAWTWISVDCRSVGS